jgi:predicted nucleic acid-binding protein
MPDAISDTSPLLYLYRVGALDWLQHLFGETWIPDAVASELEQGRQKGYNVPDLDEYNWIHRVEPRSVPPEWLALDLGPGELAAMALALENPDRFILLDDALARRIAQAAGLTVWGTLGILLEAKRQRLIEYVEPSVNRLIETGMWLSDDVRQRILILAGEQ